jgi:type I restriction enzyme R subunit
MNTESEFILEDKLIAQLVELGYESVRIDDEAMMLANLKRQLEIHNEVTLSDAEFALVLNHLNNGSVFERAQILRDMFVLKREDGENLRIRFLDTQEWCQNEYQVTHQVSIEGRRKTRYDVTILVNGLPLVQVELKRRGVELKEAFHQIQRYKRDSFDAGFGLFQYVQLFVVSNGVNTKYFSNNAKVSFEQTFY